MEWNGSGDGNGNSDALCGPTPSLFIYRHLPVVVVVIAAETKKKKKKKKRQSYLERNGSACSVLMSLGRIESDWIRVDELIRVNMIQFELIRFGSRLFDSVRLIQLA